MINTNISVIIPTWNGAKTLYTVIKSCLNQTLPPIEILVCDDGSTDDSKKIIEQINDKRVIWVPSQHSGTPAVPRNNGIKISKGEWIAFCDNDDEWLPTKLEKQIDATVKFNCKASCTDAFIKINGKITRQKVSNYKGNILSFNNILKSNDIICSSTLIHKSVLSRTNQFSEIIKNRSFADYIYWLRVLTITNFAFVVEPLVIYDDHPETSIRSDIISDYNLKQISFNDLISWMEQNDKNTMKTAYFKFKIKLYKIKQKIIFYLKNIIKYLLNIQ